MSFGKGSKNVQSHAWQKAEREKKKREKLLLNVQLQARILKEKVIQSEQAILLARSQPVSNAQEDRQMVAVLRKDLASMTQQLETTSSKLLAEQQSHQQTALESQKVSILARDLGRVQAELSAVSAKLTTARQLLNAEKHSHHQTLLERQEALPSLHFPLFFFLQN